MSSPTPTAFNNPNLDPRRAPVQSFAVPPGIGELITLVDRCWVCNGVFPEYGGENGALVQEFHHPVPRAFGGADGPVVSLCSGHHTTAHDVSLRLKSGVPYHDLVGHESLSTQSRILKLAHILVNAMILFQEDPNRRININFSLPFKKNEQLKQLARSKRTPVSNLLESVVVDLLNREFPKRRT